THTHTHIHTHRYARMHILAIIPLSLTHLLSQSVTHSLTPPLAISLSHTHPHTHTHTYTHPFICHPFESVTQTAHTLNQRVSEITQCTRLLSQCFSVLFWSNFKTGVLKHMLS